MSKKPNYENLSPEQAAYAWATSFWKRNPGKCLMMDGIVDLCESQYSAGYEKGIETERNRIEMELCLYGAEAEILKGVY